jgi:16S rRNA (cytosine967-C5)-methyltransferase
LIELNPKFISYFDKILLDAPCSGIGTLSRNPDSRWCLSKEKIKSLTLLQEKLLESIFPLLKKDGTLVYSTCTICPDENNLLIERFIEKKQNFKIGKPKANFT